MIKTVDFQGPIASAADVERFFTALIAAGCNFHPDDPLSKMVLISTGERSFDAEEGWRLDALMAQAWQAVGDEVYAIGLRCFRRHDASGAH